MAHAAGISVAQYREIEHDAVKSTPTIGKLAAIAKALDVPLSSIVEPRWLDGARLHD